MRVKPVMIVLTSVNLSIAGDFQYFSTESQLEMSNSRKSGKRDQEEEKCEGAGRK